MKILMLVFVAMIAVTFAGRNTRSGGSDSWQGTNSFNGRSALNSWSGSGNGFGRTSGNGWRSASPGFDSNQGGWASGRSFRGQSSQRYANSDDSSNGWGNSGWDNGNNGWQSSSW